MHSHSSHPASDVHGAVPTHVAGPSHDCRVGHEPNGGRGCEKDEPVRSCGTAYLPECTRNQRSHRRRTSVWARAAPFRAAVTANSAYPALGTLPTELGPQKAVAEPMKVVGVRTTGHDRRRDRGRVDGRFGGGGASSSW